jgi:hypothetical protein
MKVVGKLSLALAVALVLGHPLPVVQAAPPAHPAPVVPKTDPDDLDAAPADGAASASGASQPYGTIVARNIFGLVPIPPPAPPPDPTPTDPPPKITANGITSIFGPLQALFKVTLPAKAGQQAKETTYRLSVGQRQDDIEVVKIDEKTATITFNNHGTTQDIPLTEGTASAGPAPAAAPPQNPFAPKTPRFGERPGGFAAIGAGGQTPVLPQPNNNNNNAAGDGADDLTPVQRNILMEAERANIETSDNPRYPAALIPPPISPGRSSLPAPK